MSAYQPRASRAARSVPQAKRATWQTQLHPAPSHAFARQTGAYAREAPVTQLRAQSGQPASDYLHQGPDCIVHPPYATMAPYIEHRFYGKSFRSYPQSACSTTTCSAI